MTKILTAEQIQERLIGIAFKEEDIQAVRNEYLPNLYAGKKRLENELATLKDTIKLYESGQDTALRANLQVDFDAHLQAGGDVDVHPRIKIRRNSKWMYDQKKALAWAQENGIRDCIRTKETLDKKAMDKLVEDGHYPAEEVKSVSVIIPAMLGDLLIGTD